MCQSQFVQPQTASIGRDHTADLGRQDPGVNEHEREVKEQEAQSRMAGGGACPHLMALPVAALDVLVATHKTIDLVFHSQVSKQNRRARQACLPAASSLTLSQIFVAEGTDETSASPMDQNCR